jgi:hypothetical protein
MGILGHGRQYLGTTPRVPLAVVLFSMPRGSLAPFIVSIERVRSVDYGLHSSNFLQMLSTFFFVPSSIRISSGHGLVNPSEAHLRVASTPIFEP